LDERAERDQFERMRLHQKIEHARLVIGQYETGLAHYRNAIEDWQYGIGRLDERLGGGS
jgi:hypothetical protein